MSEGQTAGVDLLWPGYHRTGGLVSAQAFLDALVHVESAWAGRDLPVVTLADLRHADVEAGGNPVIPLVALLRERTGDPSIHRGLTSQDVVDTALMLLARDAVAEMIGCLRDLSEALVGLARAHAGTVMSGRTLTQHAVPITFGLKVARWLDGVSDAWGELQELSFDVQVGGAGGTNAALVELGRDPVEERWRLSIALGLGSPPPWHTARRPITRIGDALATLTDACGRIANDVLVLSRPEIAEVSEGAPGGSSAMPHKQNPVLAVLVRRAALTVPQLAATLHLAAAEQVDERADGGWHAEWITLRDLLARALVAVSQTAELVSGLQVRTDRMAANAAAAREALLSERDSLTGETGALSDYLGETSDLVDAAVLRAEMRLR